MKKINDTLGHLEGDKALAEVGRCLGKISGRTTIAYRVGGDEFVVIFLQQDEASIRKALQQAKEDVAKAGYSLSVGYAMKTAGRDMEELLHESDQNMYKDKSEYYRQNGMDRRRR
jgi:diguanylate cyclase (GGDEF)-like protein